MIGFINVYKPSGISSATVVNKIKKKFNLKKVGHLGTLDPMACGVLAIAVGKATRMFDFFLEKSKTYRAVFSFGYETDTLDANGEIVATTTIFPSAKEIKEALPSFLGRIQQMPPKFSAKHVDGVRAYQLARKGEEFKLKPKEVTIYQYNFLSEKESNGFECEIECSSGTYIRSMCRDLAYKLKSLATMTFLERTKNCFFTIHNAYPLEKLLISDKLILTPVEKVFADFDKYTITATEYNNIINGRHTPLSHHFTKPTFLVYEGKVIGVAKENINALALRINLI